MALSEFIKEKFDMDISRSKIQRIEADKASLTSDEIIVLCSVLEISADDWFLSGGVFRGIGGVGSGLLTDMAEVLRRWGL